MGPPMPTIRELKETLDARQVDYSGVIEKQELERLVRESVAAHAPKSDGHRTHHKRSGGSASRRSKHSSRGERSRRDGSGSSDRTASNFLRLGRAAEVLGVALDAPDEVIAAALLPACPGGSASG